MSVILPCLGTIFEYCDICLYIVYARQIALDLFCNNSAIYVYLIQFFAALARPVGAYFFGLVGDKYGPNTALHRSVLWMIVLTFLIASIPAYSVIGRWAGVLYVVLRSLQMAVCGGELNFAAISLMKSMRYKNLASGIAWSATSLGWLLANFIAYCIGPVRWRLAFVITAVFGMFSVALRRYCGMEAEVQGVPDGDDGACTVHPRSDWIVFVLSSSIAAFTYYTQQYYVLQLPRGESLLMMYVISAVMNVAAGYACDLVGRGWIVRVGVLCSFCVCVLGPRGLLLYPVLLSLWKAPMHAIVAEVVDRRRWCSQAATCYAVGTAITGQGTMFFCSLLDGWCESLSLLWPVGGLLLMLHALCMIDGGWY